MTITLTKEELSKFTSNLEDWYRGMVKYVLENIKLNPAYEIGVSHWLGDQVHKLMSQYEANYPNPDWRTLL